MDHYSAGTLVLSICFSYLYNNTSFTLQNRPNIILGIDPGTLMMGFSLIVAKGNTIELIVMDVIKLSSKIDTYKRLSIIYQKVGSNIVPLISNGLKRMDLNFPYLVLMVSFPM